MDLRTFPNWIQYRGRKIYPSENSQNDEALVRGWHNTFKNSLINAVRIITWIIVVTVGTVCCLFLFIYFRMRHREVTNLFEKGDQQQ